MNKKSVIFLGAGLPHRGSHPAALFKTSFGHKSLDWLLSAFKNINVNFTFIGGYKLNQIKKSFPKLNTEYNSDWSSTKPAFTLLKFINKVKNELFVSYTDIIYLPDVIDSINEINSDVVIAVDSFWQRRFLSRPELDKKISEKVQIKNQKVLSLGVNLPVDKSSFEFIGIVKFSNNVVNFLQNNQKKLIHKFHKKDLSILIEKLRVSNYKISYFDVRGQWAEIKYPDDIAQFIFGTKAQTLYRLKSVIKLSRIEDQISFNLEDWKKK
jgi:choline kinase